MGEINDVVKVKDLMILEMDGESSPYLVLENTNPFTGEPAIRLKSVTGKFPLIITIKHLRKATND